MKAPLVSTQSSISTTPPDGSSRSIAMASSSKFEVRSIIVSVKATGSWGLGLRREGRKKTTNISPRLETILLLFYFYFYFYFERKINKRISN